MLHILANISITAVVLILAIFAYRFLTTGDIAGAELATGLAIGIVCSLIYCIDTDVRLC